MQNKFDKYPDSNIQYGGSEKKRGILIDGFPYMLKFQTKTPLDSRINHITEYLGSHIFELLGFNAHRTFLGTYKAENVVACKDFVIDGYQFVPFNDVGESTIEEDKDKYQYSYQDIVTLLEKNKKLTNVKETVSSFFEIYIVDALIGNFDRHGANWGFLKKNNQYTLAPVFDNGSCLFPKLIDDNEIILIMKNREEMSNRVYKFPVSQIKLRGKKSSYFEVISSLEFDKINQALKKIYNRIDLNKIYKLINSTNELSTIHKQFYCLIIKERYEKILKFSYDKLIKMEQGK